MSGRATTVVAAICSSLSECRHGATQGYDEESAGQTWNSVANGTLRAVASTFRPNFLVRDALTPENLRQCILIGHALIATCPEHSSALEAEKATNVRTINRPIYRYCYCISFRGLSKHRRPNSIRQRDRPLIFGCNSDSTWLGVHGKKQSRPGQK